MIITGEEKPFIDVWILRHDPKHGFVPINRRMEQQSEVVFKNKVDAQEAADELNEIGLSTTSTAKMDSQTPKKR